MIPAQFQRTILWIVFGLSLLMLWDKWQQYNGHSSMFSPTVAESQQPADDAAKAAAKASGNGDASVPGASVLPSAATTGSNALPAGGAAAERAPGQLMSLANDVLKLDIDTTGGQIQRSQFLEHHEIEDKDKDLVLLQSAGPHTYVAQSGWVGAPQGAFPNHRSAFTVVKAPSGRADDPEQTLTLAAESGSLRVERTYRLKRGEYLLHVQDKVTNTGDQTLRPTLYMQLTRDGDKPAGQSQFYSTYTGPVIYTDKSKFHKIDFSDIEKKKATFDKTAEDGWIGIIQHYFVAAWLPSDKAAREYYADKVEENLYRVGAKEVIAELAPGASSSVDTRLLVAPQDQRMLSQIAPGLDLTVDYGWLTVIAKPIYSLLSWLHTLVGNWGWSIVLLTIIIKTIFFPLQAASYKSMARMKAVTPRMTALRERYKDDRARMNQAMMELYKEEKINPLGGCLPIVVQIPVFIALYWVLLASVEMRNAPWLGWIKDLAAPDPYYILPLVMAGTMFLQTKLNPTPPDPVQAKMMLFMPLIFSVMFFFFPSGLVLYWLVNNVYSIVQQWVITRKIAPNKVLS